MRIPAAFAVMLLAGAAGWGAPEGADAAALKKAHAAAFRALALPSPAALAKELPATLPPGIVTEAGPFDALIDKLAKAHEAQMAEREKVMEGLGGLPPAEALPLVRSATETLSRENADLQKRLAGVEADYGEVYDRGYMESSEGIRATRKGAAVLIPLYRRLLLRNEGVALRSAAALARLAAAGGLPALVSAARTDPLPRLRAAAVDALALHGGDEARAALREVLAGDKDPLVRVRALGALFAWPLAAVKGELVGALQDPAWNVRALAVAACARGDLLEAVGPLIEALARETGRLRKDIDDALFRLTKTQFLGDVALWRSFFESNRERLAKEAEERAKAGAYDRPLGPPSSWEREGGAGGEEKARKDETSAFYGIPTVSRRILYLIDISQSMETAAEAQPAARTGGKTKYPAPATRNKIDIARWQLHRAVEDLPEDAAFNIIVYSESYRVWQEAMSPAKAAQKKKAHKFIDDLKQNGVTNICDPLDKAFEIAGWVPAGSPAARGEPAADTLYLLSDGDPNRGRIADLARLLDDIAARNPPGGIVIHTVGIGEAAGSSFLRDLADRNGGRYVGYK